MANNLLEAFDAPAALEAKKPRQPSDRELEAVRRLLGQADYVGAERAARALTVRYRKSSVAWRVASVALARRGETRASLDAAQRAVSASPEDPEARCNLANLLRLLGRLAEAEAECREALALKPDCAAAHVSLGATLKFQGRAEESGDCCRRALEIDPRYAPAHSNLAVVLWESGKFDEAEDHFRRAIEAGPHLAEFHNNLASLLARRGRWEEAEAASRRALELMPTLAEAWNNLGLTLQGTGRNREAIEAYRRAIALKQDYPDAHDSLLFCLSHEESVTSDELFAEHAAYGRHFGAPLRARWPAHRNSREPERKLRIGFVSGDLRDHATAYFLEPLLPHLAADSGLSLHAYSNSGMEDDVSSRLRESFGSWTRVAAIGDDALAAQIERDGIDILVDLSGHTNGNRLLTFARKPAPVQASWLGYLGTTGLEAMDYYLGDPSFLPRDRFASQFTEKIVHLAAVWAFLPSSEAPAVNDLPARSNGYLTLGSFNNLGKLSPAVIALWSKLLRALPEAKMLIGALPAGSGHPALLGWFADEGIGADRLRLFARSGLRDYLALHHQVDLCLDAFPYAGGATTCHGIWMGVPTLTLDGKTPAGRWCAGLRHMGLDGFAADGKEQFVAMGLRWAGDLDGLAELRSRLRERFAQSPISRPEAVAASMAEAFRTMWRRWCAGLAPEAF